MDIADMGFGTRSGLLGRLHRYPRYKIIVLGLLIALAAFLLPKLAAMISMQQNTATGIAQRDMARIIEGLQLYRKDNGTYPSAEQGLLALILKPARGSATPGWKTGGYIDRLPHDPWGHSYQYRINESEQTYQVFSYGPAGPEAGDDSDSIITAR